MSGIKSNASLPDHVRSAFTAIRSGAEAGRMAHSYVVSCGSIEDGQSLAIVLLQWLQCTEADKPCGCCRSCLQVAAQTHPDVTWVEPESKSRVIKIDQVRALNHIVSQKSFEGGWKAAVLLHAERLNESSANAFLKTLEEPPPQSLLLLVTESPQELLPTIVSRCQRVHIAEDEGGAVASNVETAMLEWLRQRGRGAAPSQQAAWINAILGEIRSRAEDIEKQKAEEAGREIDKDMLVARVQTQSIEARMEILRILYKWERDIVVCAMAEDTTALNYPAEREALLAQGKKLRGAALFDRLRKVEEASRLLERNVPEATVWEALLPV